MRNSEVDRIVRGTLLKADAERDRMTPGQWFLGVWRALLPMAGFALLGVSAAHWFSTCWGGS